MQTFEDKYKNLPVALLYEINNRIYDRLPENEKIVVKASGLAQGKGVFICENPMEAKICAKEMMVSASLGSAGETVVIEEFLQGDEVSVSSRE